MRANFVSERRPREQLQRGARD